MRQHVLEAAAVDRVALEVRDKVLEYVSTGLVNGQIIPALNIMVDLAAREVVECGYDLRHYFLSVFWATL